jgi:hypothetical protein
MDELVSEDVLGWARDLAAVRKLFASGRSQQAVAAPCLVLTPAFGSSRAQPPLRGQRADKESLAGDSAFGALAVGAAWQAASLR